MTNQLTIIKIEVITTKIGMDRIFLTTNKPEPCYPFKGNLTVSFPVARGTWREYIEENFPGVPFNEVNVG